MLDTIYLQILDMSKTASIVILVVLLARLLLRKAPKVFSYALWAVVLFRLLCPFSFEAPVSAVPAMPSVSQGYTLSEESISVVGASEAVYQAVGDAFNGGLGVQQIQTTEQTADGMTKYVTMDWWSVWILFGKYVWVTGVVAMLLYSAVSYGRIRKKLAVVVPLRENIYLADDIQSPFVVGLFRPNIYLPCHLEEREQVYIILHEQYHIRRFDHIAKGLAFFALSLHWFNPLVWVAFVLASQDMEMSCDEAVIRKIGSDMRAEYATSLLTLATGRRSIAGTPLAFGEGDTKGRIHNLANWKQPTVCVALTATIACIILAVGLLANPVATREFPIDGKNISELNTERIVQKIAEAEKLEDGGQLYVNADNFDLMLTADFNWANDGAIRFFYRKNQNTYNAQLRMFHEENKYFITERTKWPEQNKIFRLVDYLNALKHMPQEEIRALSPDADEYSVWQVYEGIPSDYTRVLTYNQNGVADIEGWYIHLVVQPLYRDDGNGAQSLYGNETDTGYFGHGEEVIHLFYGHTNQEPFLGDILPGTTYVPYQCLYMNLLSSYAAIGGDSGCKYVVGEDYFATIYRSSNRIAMDGMDTTVNEQRIAVPKWEWQEFPYTNAEWAALYWPRGIFSMDTIREQYSEIRYQPLNEDSFLLKMDSSLWLVHLSNDPKVGTYLWSIYSLVPESAMGVAQWEFQPSSSSHIPVFQFAFAGETTEILASCSDGLLIDWEHPSVPSDMVMTFQENAPLSWAPVRKDGTVATDTIIHFTIQRTGMTPYNGTLYIESEEDGGVGESRTYTATIVGTGLHLEQNTETGGGILSVLVPDVE